MNIKFEDLLTVFDLNEKKYSELESIIFDYGTLKQKLQNIDEQSWLFKKGLKNHNERLIELKKEYNEIRSDFNSTSLDDLIIQLNKNKEDLELFKHKLYRSMIDQIAMASLRSKIVYIKLLIDIRSRTEDIKEIEYYFKNREGLIRLLGL